MAYSFPVIALVFAAVAVPAVSRAQSPGGGRDSQTCCENRILTDPAPRGVGVRTMRLGIILADPRPVPRRPEVYTTAYFPSGPAQPQTAVNHQFSPAGLVGSAGYMRSANRHIIAHDDAGLAGCVGLNSPGDLVGVRLHYDFR